MRKGKSLSSKQSSSVDHQSLQQHSQHSSQQSLQQHSQQSSQQPSQQSSQQPSQRSTPFNQVYEIVVKIPRGRVLTYGAISKMIGQRLSAAAVGWAMRALPEDASKTKNGSKYHSKSVPWHRVINSRGGISTANEPGIPSDLQQTLLEAEGVVFDAQGTIDLKKHLWNP